MLWQFSQGQETDSDCQESSLSSSCVASARNCARLVSVCRFCAKAGQLLVYVNWGFPYRGRGEMRWYPMEERVSRLYSWVSTYYAHSDLTRTTRNPALLHTAPLPYPAPPSVRHATLDSISPAALEAVSWPGTIHASEALLYCILLSVAFKQARCMLLDICQNKKFTFSFQQNTYLGLAQVITSTASTLGFWYIQLYWKISTKVVRSLPSFYPWERSIANGFSLF